MKPRSFKIREILATNSQKTIELELETFKGKVRSSVPIGTSKSKYEVKYLPTQDVIRKFHLIRRHFTSEELFDQKDVDILIRIIDKTPDFREIGGNLALGISSVFLKAFALENNQRLFEYLASMRKEKPKIPRPICNVIGGWYKNSDVQEYELLPLHQKSFADSISKISSAYLSVGNLLKSNDPSFSFSKNLESGWVSSLGIGNVLEILSREASQHLLKIGIDFAATHMFENEKYVYRNSNKSFSKSEQLSYVEDLARRFPIIYLEDPFHEDDFISFATLTHRLNPKIICGDDLYSTNEKRLRTGLEFKATNAIIIKPNQVGTISDVLKIFDLARKNNLTTVISHRSGETEDTLIAHLAVGLGADYIKIGISGERTVKINEMIRIEENLI